MKTEVSNAPSAPPQLLDYFLKSAVVLNWDALTQSSASARIRVEYHIGSDGGLEYLKMWNTARGYWSLVCEYSTHLGWSDGPRFCNGYHSRSLGRLLQSIFMNQSLYTHDRGPNGNGILDVGPPTTEDLEAAKLQVSEALQPTNPVRGSKRVEARLVPAQGSQKRSGVTPRGPIDVAIT
jgi:hypothetical protein